MSAISSETMLVPNSNYLMHLQRNAASHIVRADTLRLMEQSRQLLEARSYKEAIHLLAQVIAIDRSDAEASFYLAIAHSELAGQEEMATRFALEAIKIEPNYLPYLKCAFRCATISGHFEEAHRCYQMMEEKYPFWHEEKLAAVRMYLSAGRPEAAAMIRHGSALQLDDDDALSLDVEISTAISTHAKSVQLASKAFERISSESRDFQNALSLIDQAHRAYASDRRISANRGLLLAATGQYEPALDVLMSVSRGLPKEAGAICIFNAAYCALRLASITKAEEIIHEGIETLFEVLGHPDSIPIEALPGLAYWIGVSGVGYYFDLDETVRVLVTALRTLTADDKEHAKALDMLLATYRGHMRTQQSDVNELYASFRPGEQPPELYPADLFE